MQHKTRPHFIRRTRKQAAAAARLVRDGNCQYTASREDRQRAARHAIDQTLQDVAARNGVSYSAARRGL